MAFDSIVANPGSGGEAFAFDQFIDSDAELRTMAYTAIAFGPLGGPYPVVTANNPLPVRDPVSSGQVTHSSETSIAAGGQASIQSASINSGKTGKLLGVLVWSSTPFKATLQVVSNGSATTKGIGGAPSGTTWDFKPPHRDLIQSAYDANAGFDGFQVVIDNLDGILASNAYATFYYDEVDS